MLYQSDHNTMLTLQAMVQKEDPCVYLEIGSLLGGSMVPYLLDNRCTEVHSVDLRPDLTPDERFYNFDYDHATTAQMIANLKREVPDENMKKLRTYDMDTAAFVRRPGPHPRVRPNLVFLDAEHTNRAVFQDFLNLRGLLPKDAIFAFHDSNLIFDALTNIKAMLRYEGVEFGAGYLPDVVFAIAFGKYIEPMGTLDFWPEAEYLANARSMLIKEASLNRAKAGI
jgi:cephalosporin hydroxylase